MPFRLVLCCLLAAAALSGCGSGPTHPSASSSPTPELTMVPIPPYTPPSATAPPVKKAPAPTTVSATPRAHRTSSPVAPTAPPSGVTRRFPVQGCTVSYGRSHHDYPATDIFAARGCAVVAPVTGRVDEVSTVDRWSSSTNNGADRGGLSFSIVGDDGVRYYGSHLQTITIRAGQRIAAGASIGTVGNSGSARVTATHLHFGLSWPTRPGIWWVRRGEVYPWPYLDSWRTGGDKSPAAAVAAEHQRQGDVPPCRIDC